MSIDAAAPRHVVGYVFPWQPLRDWYDAVADGKTPCDFRRAIREDRPGTGDCAAPVQFAAKTSNTMLEIKPEGLVAHTFLDRGFRDGVTNDWFCALLDTRGQVVGRWVHPDHVEREHTACTIPVKDESAKRPQRAALVKDRP